MFAEDLFSAAGSNNLVKVQELIRFKNYKGSFGYTSLHYAVIRGHIEICKYLIDQGVDINVKDNGGRSPLHHGALNGCVNICEYLIQQGADINANSFGFTPLHYAATCGSSKLSLEVSHVLLDFKADINTVTETCYNNALHLAAQFGHKETCILLVEHGINPHTINKLGKSPIDIAKNDEIKHALLITKELSKTNLEELKRNRIIEKSRIEVESKEKNRIEVESKEKKRIKDIYANNILNFVSFIIVLLLILQYFYSKKS